MREQRAKYPQSTFISHPRSGLTWFRWMLHEVRKRHDPENLKSPPLETEEWNPLIAYDHDGVGTLSVQSRKKRHPRTKGINKWAGYRVVFLMRDPRDVMISNWFFLVIRGRSFPGVAKRVEHYGDINAFFKCANIGLLPLVSWVRWWEEHKAECVDFMPIFYEETLKEPFSSLSCVLEMATDEDVPSGTLEDVVKASSFDVMKKHEREHGRLFKDQDGGVVDGNDQTTVIRRGVAGQWEEELSGELKAWCREAMEPLRGTFAERYLA